MENALVNEIQKLEENIQTTEALEDLNQKKSELQILRQEKMRGHYVRSKMQWVEEGERSSKYFLNLETKNFVNKTIPRLVNNEGCLINKQEHILLEAKNFYTNLYSKKDTINSVDLNKEIPFLDVPKLTNEIRDTLEGKISYSELTAAIKRMKSNKSPGSDGYTSEFFKFFWIDLGKIVLRPIKFG